MSVFHAFILGLTQGLTEFLPISSSGHLVIVRWAFGWNEQSADLAKTFDVALHLGTLIAVVSYFWRDVVFYVRAGLRSFSRQHRHQSDTRIAQALLLSAIPGAAVGAAFNDTIEEHLSQPLLIGVMLIVFGFVLLYADRAHGHRSEKEFGFRDALLMGAAQAVALQPGVSRAGATMTAARGVKFDRSSAARLSFLMSIPIISGAVVFKLGDVIANGIPDQMQLAFFVGIITSAISGALAIGFLLKLLKTKSFTPFVIYRFVVGSVIIATALVR